MRRFKCRNLGSPVPESTALGREGASACPPLPLHHRKRYQSDPDLVFGELSTSVADHHFERKQKNGVREKRIFVFFHPTNKPCFVFSEALVLTRMGEFCTAAAKYKDEDELANEFKESLYSMLCFAKYLCLKKILGTVLSTSSSVTSPHASLDPIGNHFY